MQTNEHVDLATWLTAVWDEEEARLTHPTFCGPVWPTTAQLLARIAADRKILAHVLTWTHRVVDEDCWFTCPAATEERDGGETCNDDERGKPCQCGLEWRQLQILGPLASAHADKPSFRPEWLVERQGVEHR